LKTGFCALVAGAGMVAFAGLANATMITADFDTGVAASLSHGNDQSAVNTAYASFGGLTLTFMGSNGDGTSPLPSFDADVAIFDTDLTGAACGADCDLNVNNGNALIVQNSGFQTKTGDVFDTPDDDGNGSTIKMTVNFGADILGVVLQSISIIDIEELLEVRNDAFAVETSGDNGNQQISSLTNIGLVINNGDDVYFRMTGSGAIDDLEFDVTAVPAPPMLPLLATALAGLGIFGWRKKRDRAA